MNGQPQALHIKHLGLLPYTETWDSMKQFTIERSFSTVDELWVLQHPPVFTQGQAGKAEHILLPGDIPVVQTDRGGQVTYHGPGQLVVYCLFDLKRLGIGTKQLVNALENSMIAVLGHYSVMGSLRQDAPGVYVNDAKIGSIGLRVKRGCSYHGLSLNVDMNLEPFTRINPCGYHKLKMTQLALESKTPDLLDVSKLLITEIVNNLGYAEKIETDTMRALP